MTKRLRITALAVIGALGLGLMAPTAAHAGSKGRRNTAIALGAVALYGIVKKKPVIAGVGAAGAVYSYISSRNARKKELRRERYRRYARRGYYGGGRRRYGGRRYYGGGYRQASYYGGRRHPHGWSRGRKRGWYKNGRYCN